jgi:hypothetical protein
MVRRLRGGRPGIGGVWLYALKRHCEQMFQAIIET